ncbi:cation:proton antiporter regulatory subunit [Cryptosporangium arvum]|uniref:cation:proton antiporter regulatory subunit n=1 Tax=Cryptosporangium arvum TaxID=80871 RepID=UPI0004BC27ED|nr:cation:proton antiporter regulatory subunit [Cryptosporangium arvum]
MSARVEQRALPGIGVVQDVVTKCGRRIGVLTHRDGHRELVVYDVDDPDAASETVPLTGDEANAIAELLGAPQLVRHLAEMQEQVIGVLTEQLPILKGSAFAGRPLGDTQARTRTGASIVAVLRQGEVIASPGPSFVFEAGDSMVVVGTREGVDGVASILRGDA